MGDGSPSSGRGIPGPGTDRNESRQVSVVGGTPVWKVVRVLEERRFGSVNVKGPVGKDRRSYWRRTGNPELSLQREMSFGRD